MLIDVYFDFACKDYNMTADDLVNTIKEYYYDEDFDEYSKTRYGLDKRFVDVYEKYKNDKTKGKLIVNTFIYVYDKRVGANTESLRRAVNIICKSIVNPPSKYYINKRIASHQIAVYSYLLESTRNKVKDMSRYCYNEKDNKGRYIVRKEYAAGLNKMLYYK